MTTTASEHLRERLVAQLVTDGAIRSLHWRQAFTDIARHHFAHAFRHRHSRPTETDEGIEYLSGSDPATRDRWLEVVYTDDSLVTQYDAAGTATSSSTQPSLMASMLEALDLHDDHRVLEIGTGTGYNSALLSHRVGHTNVTSIEIDSAVADAARTALNRLGYRPTVITGDGLDGFADGAPYDRIIATCSTNRVPAAWLKQCVPGGVVLANIGLGVVQLHVADDGHGASGRFLPGFAGFIEARPADGHESMTHTDVIDRCHSTGTQTPATVPPDLDNKEFGVFGLLCIPGLARVVITTQDGPTEYLFAEASSKSWARASTADGGTVTQGGPGSLWNKIDSAHTRWVGAGRPNHDRLGLNININGNHELWVDTPTKPHRWTLDN